MDNEHLERGRQLLNEMSGGRGADAEARWRALNPDLAELIVGFVAGEIWARPGLDRKTRSLITVAAMTALGRRNALELNLNLALGNGATEAEIVEVLLHMAAYAGFPACWDGMEIAARVFEQHREASSPDRPA